RCEARRRLSPGLRFSAIGPSGQRAPMNHLEIQTSLGEICVVGRLHATVRPTLLVIPGSFTPPEYKHELVDAFPGASVLISDLPGMRSPMFRAPTAKNYATAFDELLSVLPHGSPVVVYSLSTGCLVALGMRSPRIVGHVLEEPFFSTANLWPLVQNFQ